jgi:hypothetical protein
MGPNLWTVYPWGAATLLQRWHKVIPRTPNNPITCQQSCSSSQHLVSSVILCYYFCAFTAVMRLS